ncbi:hypothetical protein VTN49DRAFT_1035 [Thermomyces lanuginosus]|uniref:uncharacterized protein n=1 Tax=Thermomyces lanuginosus TaxID=5541 RepID=UPI003744A6C3
MASQPGSPNPHHQHDQTPSPTTSTTAFTAISNTTTTAAATNRFRDNRDEDNKEKRTSEALAAFTASLHSIGTNLSAPLRTRAADIHANAHALAQQEERLAQTTADLARQNDQWQRQFVDETTKGLKELGDLQNWAEMIERDLLVVEETIKLAEGGGRDDSD